MVRKPILLLLFVFPFIFCDNCLEFDISIAQKVEHEGLHRDINWLVEIISPNILEVESHECSFVLRLDVNRGVYVNPDQIADLRRLNVMFAYIDGEVNIESIAYESKPHIVYIFLNTSEKMSVSLPIHLRYHRAQITGGYSRIVLEKPSLLVKCKDIIPCGKDRKLQGACDCFGRNTCVYRNVTYEALFELAEMFVPIGDLDDYPLISILTMLLGCAGCIYILSILSLNHL